MSGVYLLSVMFLDITGDQVAKIGAYLGAPMALVAAWLAFRGKKVDALAETVDETMKNQAAFIVILQTHAVVQDRKIEKLDAQLEEQRRQTYACEAKSDAQATQLAQAQSEIHDMRVKIAVLEQGAV